MAKDDVSLPEHHGPLLIEGPKAAESAAPIIDLEPLTADTGASAGPAEAAPPPGWRWPVYTPLAAGIAMAVVAGALAGAGATVALMRDTTPPATLAVADATRALQDSVTQLGNDLATLKVGISTAQRSASTQFGKLAERLDRSEKAQTEPVGKLAKLQDSIDRLERRQQVAAAPSPEITGSIAAKDESKPPVAEGWRLRDFYDGRAVVESRNGTLFRIGPGSNVPGLGKVESIKRENGKIVVLTAAGTIAGAVDARRPPYYYRW